MVIRNYKTYDSKLIKKLRIFISIKKQKTYWVFMNDKWTRVAKIYFFELKAKGIEIILKSVTVIKKNQLGVTNEGVQCSRLVLDNYCFQHDNVFKNKSPLRYPGGKTRACKILHEIIGEYFDFNKLKFIISPFFGGGSFEFFLSNRYNYSIVANDIYPYLANFWNICKKKNKRLYALLMGVSSVTKENFVDYKKKLKITKDPLLQAYYFFILNRCSFNGTIESGGFSELASKNRFTKSSINRIMNLNLSKFTINNSDFEVFLKKQKKKSLIFLDPPYFSNKKSNLYGKSGDLHRNFDHIRLFKCISKQSNWVLTYDNCSFIKNLYKDYKQIEVSWAYGMGRSKNELVILGKKCQRNYLMRNYQKKNLKKKLDNTV